MIAEYQQWSDANLETTTEEGALAAWLTIHNAHASSLSNCGVSVPVLTTLSDGLYGQEMQPLINYLAKQNWIAAFGAPLEVSVETAAGVVYRRTAMVELMPVIGRKTGNLTSTTGKNLSYTVDIVQGGWRYQPARFRMVSKTTGTHVVHYLSDFEIVADNVAQSLFAMARATKFDQFEEIDYFEWMQWQSEFDVKNPLELKGRLVGDLMQNSNVHELQHVKDLELTTATDDLSRSANQRSQLHAFLEARGVLASLADGVIPIYALGHIRHWADGNDLDYKVAGKMALGGLNLPKNAHPALAVERAKSLQGQMDQLYPIVLRNLDKENLMEVVLKEARKIQK